MNHTKRIQLFGGGGAGKSTASHFLMHKLKASGHTAEFVGEIVKPFAYAGVDLDPQIDQAIITGRQLEAEMTALRTGCDFIVSESPILLGAVYDSTEAGRAHWLEIALRLDQDYHSRNLFLHRGAKNFVPHGRWGGRENAVRNDNRIDSLLDKFGVVLEARHDDFDEMWKLIQESFKELAG